MHHQFHSNRSTLHSPIRAMKSWAKLTVLLSFLISVQAWGRASAAKSKPHSVVIEATSKEMRTWYPELEVFLDQAFQAGKFPNSKFKDVPDKEFPEMIFYDNKGYEVERVDISTLDRNQLNAEIATRGFKTLSTWQLVKKDWHYRDEL